MKFSRQLGLILAGLISVSFGWNNTVQAAPRKYFCAQLNEIYTTFVRTPLGNSQLIRWVYSAPGWSPRDRCIAVSKRFQAFSDNGVLQEIGYGKVNKQPVICVVRKIGEPCTNQTLLLTLKPGDDPEDIRDQLFDTSARARGKVLELSNDQLITYKDGRSYLNIKLLEKALPDLEPAVPDSKLKPIE